MSLAAILLLLAFVAFVLATFNVSLGSLNLVALGLAFLTLRLALGLFEGLGSTTVLILVLVIVLVAVLAFVLQRLAPPRAK